MKKIAICVNLDTLALGTGWALPSSDDPTYRLIDERLIGRLGRSGITLTLFTVGKDLESVENREFVRKWSRSGHEVGNHTYSHPLNLASLTRKKIREEIEKTDREIKKITGEKPRGFNAPGWAVSKEINKVLGRLEYSYDLSPFVSWWIYPLLFRQWWSLRRENIASTVWRRRDIFYPLTYKFGLTKASRKIRRIPLPMTTPLSIPVWHTGWFIFGEKIFSRLLKSAINKNPRFYYLMHPADVMDVGDIPVQYVGKVSFERIDAAVRLKMKCLDQALKILSTYQSVTAGELAETS